MIRFPKKVVLEYGYDSCNFPLKIKNDKLTEAAWKNLTKTNTLDEAYRKVIEEMVK